ncbi:MAG TPA: hypothetical protein VLF68_04560 [Candidatus Saccharimonadales bacterium]|nr:hypothetical protein [Candidatus Saccharimonadales bacterium]
MSRMPIELGALRHPAKSRVVRHVIENKLAAAEPHGRFTPYPHTRKPFIDEPRLPKHIKSTKVKGVMPLPDEAQATLNNFAKSFQEEPVEETPANIDEQETPVA